MTGQSEAEAIAAASEALARCWNRLDPGVIEPWLAERIRYDSHDTELMLEGKEQVLGHLQRKVALIELVGEDARIRAQLGTVETVANPRRPCVISSQGGIDRAALFLVSVDRGGLIERIQVCTIDPDPNRAIGSGRYPE